MFNWLKARKINEEIEETKREQRKALQKTIQNIEETLLKVAVEKERAEHGR